MSKPNWPRLLLTTPLREWPRPLQAHARELLFTARGREVSRLVEQGNRVEAKQLLVKLVLETPISVDDL